LQHNKNYGHNITAEQKPDVSIFVNLGKWLINTNNRILICLSWSGQFFVLKVLVVHSSPEVPAVLCVLWYKLYCTHKTNIEWLNIKIKPKVYLKQVLTEVSLPCMCLESFGSPVILSSSFLCPYPNLPSFADKKDKIYQHTTLKERFRTSAQRKQCLMAQD